MKGTAKADPRPPWKRARLVALLALALVSCQGSPPAPADAGATVAPPAAELPGVAGARVEAILVAEHRRDAGAITAADQQSREAPVRRAAARALARIGGEGARAGLLRALADEDDEVVAWGAYGLGFWCRGHEKQNVSALVARALSRSSAPAGTPSPRLDASSAIARAVGRCGAEESEPTLVAWLAGPRERAVAAAYGLGDLAGAAQKLREETLAALLNLAAGSAAAPPVPEALFAFGRLKHVPETVVTRIREVAGARLAQADGARLFAVKALAHTSDDGAIELGRVLASPGTFTAAERSEAAKALGRMKAAGQRPLAEALPGLVPGSDPLALTGLVSEDFEVILAALDAVDPSAVRGPAKKALATLAALPLPPGAPPSIARRVSWLRCGAAKALAGDDHRDRALAACDLTTAAPIPAPAVDGGASDPGRSPARGMPPGSIGARATVAVLGRGELTGARLAAYRAFAVGDDLRAREAALELLKTHDEVEGAAAILTEALLAREGGAVGTAAEVIAQKPQRAGADATTRKPKRARGKKRPAADQDPPIVDPGAPSPALVKALLGALSRPDLADDLEVLDQLIEAAGALALKEAKPRIDALCRSPYPTTREHAAKALGLIGGDKRACEPPTEGAPVPAELDHLARAPVTLALDTDAGAMTITLDPALAPVMATRIADLARAGYYDGMVVHRVDAGFVTQLGAPLGDGYGGPDGKPSLRCETSPLHFAPLLVGVALSGRDTGSSQLFVMHASAPHLDGNYPLIGSATGPWAAFTDGDVIRRVEVRGP